MGLDIYFYQQVFNDKTTDIIPGEANEIGYFWKINALINWVNNHVGHVENGEPLLIDKTQLRQLYHVLQQLTPENCQETFPTVSGFFFGSIDYDDRYWKDVAFVKSWLKALLSTFNFTRHRIYFFACW